MAQVHVESVVKRIPIIHIGLDDAVWRLRTGRLINVAGQIVLGVPPDPIRARAVGGPGGTSPALLGADERRGRVYIEWPVDTERMRADVIDVEYPVVRYLMLKAEGPLLRVGVQEAVGIADQSGSREELIEVRAVAWSNIEAAQRNLRSWREGGKRNGGNA